MPREDIRPNTGREPTQDTLWGDSSCDLEVQASFEQARTEHTRMHCMYMPSRTHICLRTLARMHLGRGACSIKCGAHTLLSAFASMQACRTRRAAADRLPAPAHRQPPAPGA